MTVILFEEATKEGAKARIALTGPSNSGKTYTGLMLGTELAQAEGGELLVIDTEHRAASKYVGTNGWRFKRYNATSFDPAWLTDALAAAGDQGFPAVLIDSWSHFWMGPNGMLEQVDRRTAASRAGNSFSSGWKDMTPVERRSVESILGYPGHVIVTLRVKTEYVQEKNDQGKAAPRKVGLKPIQRDGFEYEFDVVGDLDIDNNLVISKTRVPMLHGQVIHKPGPELAITIRDWLADGEEVPGPLAYRAEALDSTATLDGLKDLYTRVQAAGLTGAPVVDADQNPMTLGELILARGHAVKRLAAAS